jgi:DNA-binding HxlR family transcriptional regulator
MAKKYTPLSAAQDVEAALRLLEGRWKLVILFHLFGGKVLRYSDLERAIPNITQKMLGQQLRQLESDGIVVRKAYPQVPPRVEYSLNGVGSDPVPGAGCDFEVGRSAPLTYCFALPRIPDAKPS